MKFVEAVDRLDAGEAQYGLVVIETGQLIKLGDKAAARPFVVVTEETQESLSVLQFVAQFQDKTFRRPHPDEVIELGLAATG